jgi:hypothetical protein
MSDQNRNDLLETMEGVSRAEMDEILRLRETLGSHLWDEIQRTHWNEIAAARRSAPTAPPDPSVWSTFLQKLRAAARR